MKTTVIKAMSRGHADHGWLESYHTFSFAGYYHPQRLGFGSLRVLNDDKVAAGKGFGTHPHDNMEIISIPLSGSLEHRDSMDTVGIIGPNDVQAMSAGTGILHSEYNHSSRDEVEFLQLWIFPKLRNTAPRYDQKTFDPALRQNGLQRLVSPMEDSSDSVKINQNAYISRSKIDKGQGIGYDVLRPGNGVFVFVLEGSVALDGEILERRDAITIEGAVSFAVKATDAADILFIEVPMNLTN